LSQAKPDQDLISAYRDGDETAASELFERYYVRLLDLIRRQLGWKVRELEGTTDVAQSVLRSFFDQLRHSQIKLTADDSLWPLLTTIALNKMRNRGKFWQREKRDAGRQVQLAAEHDPLEQGPSPQDVAAVKELVDKLLEPFSDRRRQIIRLILEGQAVGKIAAEVGSTQRTVYNTRKAAAEILQRVMAGNTAVSAG
jgi:RNA polymerase sigma-70 factor (ECF subfamily)